MLDRAALLSEFLSNTPWVDYSRRPLAGDASMRKYTRLIDAASERSVMVMDAPPELGEDVRPFVKVATYLSGLGLSAPEIFEADEERGFLVIEDFGDALFDRVCASNPNVEMDIYGAAVDALTTLAMAPPLEGAEDYHPRMLDLALSCYRWYAAPVSGRDAGDDMETCRAVLSPLITSLGAGSVTTLRDFHAQNLLWLPNRATPANVGLLDFQDAMLGHPAYDLVSLTTDARRDVPQDVQAMCVKRFMNTLEFKEEDFLRSVAICSVQRNLRILMIFARMSLYFKRPHYVDLIPRVWAHLMRDLEHPDLRDLAVLLKRHLPAPTPETLEILKDKCGTVSTL